MNINKLFKCGMLAVLTTCVGGCGGMLAGSVFPPVHFPTTPQPDAYPDMPAVVLLDNATLQYAVYQNGQVAPNATLTHHRRYKILTSKGAQFATLVLPLDVHSDIIKVQGRVVYPDGREVTLTANDIQRQAGRVRPELGRVIARLPAPEVGAVVDFWYERHYDDARYVPIWNIGSDLPVVRAEFAVVTPPEVLLDMRHGEGQIISREQPVRRDLESGLTRLLWVVNNLPPLYPEDGMPDLQRLRSWVAPVFKGVRVDGRTQQYGAINTWEDVAGWYLNATKKSDNPAVDFNSVAPAGDDPAFYRWLQGQAQAVNTPYLWEAAGEAVRTVPLVNPVSVRDLAAFQVAGWRARGYEAYPALVVQQGGRLLTEDLPSLMPFTHVVVAIKKGSSYIFSDPACPQCGYGQLPLELQGGAALLVKGQQAVEFISLPVSAAADNSRFAEFNFKLRPTGELDGVFTLRAHGEAARQLRQEMVKSKKEQKAALLSALINSGTSLDISNWEVGDLKNMNAPVRVTGACSAAIKEIKYQEYKFTADQITGELFTKLWRDRRRYQLATGGPLVMELKLNIEMPVGYEVDQPLPVEVVTPFGRYASSYQAVDRIFTFYRRLEINTPLVENQDYGAFLDFIKKARQAEALGITFLSTEE